MTTYVNGISQGSQAPAPFTPSSLRSVSTGLASFTGSRIESAAEAGSAAAAAAVGAAVVATEAGAPPAFTTTTTTATLSETAQALLVTAHTNLAAAAGRPAAGSGDPVVVDGAPAPAAAPAAPATNMTVTVTSQGYCSRMCDKISHFFRVSIPAFFASIKNWVVSFCTFAPTEEVVPPTLLSELQVFSEEVNKTSPDAGRILAQYAFLIGTYPTAQARIERGVYDAAVSANSVRSSSEQVDVSSPTFGTDYMHAQPAGEYVKAALAAYIRELEVTAPAPAPATVVEANAVTVVTSQTDVTPAGEANVTATLVPNAEPASPPVEAPPLATAI